MFKAATLYEVLNPIYYAGKMFGLAPFGLARHRYEKSKINLAWSLVVSLTVCVYSYVTVVERPPPKSITISKISEIIDSYLGNAGMFVGMFLGLLYSNQALNVINDVVAFDKSFQSHVNLRNEYERSKRNVVVTLLILIMGFVIFIGLLVNLTVQVFQENFVGDSLTYVGPLVIGTLVEFQFCTLVLCLKQRFRWLNKIIVKIPKALKCSCKVITLRRDVDDCIENKAIYILEKIRRQHHKLCGMTKDVNEIFSVQILFLVVQNFITIIAGIFYSGKHVLTSKTVSIKYMVYSIYHVLLTIAQILALVITCFSVSKEAGKTGFLMNTVMSNSNFYPESVELEVSYFSLQLFHQKTSFSACEIFSIDPGLVLSMLGSITTYIVIVIQFELGNYFHEDPIN